MQQQWGAEGSLRGATAADLAAELLLRVSRGEWCPPAVGGALQMALEKHLDHHQNHFGTQHLIDLFHRFHGFTADVVPLEAGLTRLGGYARTAGFRARLAPIRAATVVNLGCGVRNPLGYLMVLLLAGARRGIGIDLEMPSDISTAVRAAARSAAFMLLDPRLIVRGYPVARADVVGRLDGFDLRKMFWGDAAGIDETRLAFRRASIHQTGLADGEADLVVSNSLLEHVPELDRAVEELARVTRPGGINAHYIDGADHRSYRDDSLGPLAFLEAESAEELVHGSNRVRPLDYRPLFESRGFEVLHEQRWPPLEITEQLRARLVEPYRSMPADKLAHTQVRFMLRRRS